MLQPQTPQTIWQMQPAGHWAGVQLRIQSPGRSCLNSASLVASAQTISKARPQKEPISEAAFACPIRRGSVCLRRLVPDAVAGASNTAANASTIAPSSRACLYGREPSIRTYHRAHSVQQPSAASIDLARADISAWLPRTRPSEYHAQVRLDYGAVTRALRPGRTSLPHPTLIPATDEVTYRARTLAQACRIVLFLLAFDLRHLKKIIFQRRDT